MKRLTYFAGTVLFKVLTCLFAWVQSGPATSLFKSSLSFPKLNFFNHWKKTLNMMTIINNAKNNNNQLKKTKNSWKQKTNLCYWLCYMMGKINKHDDLAIIVFFLSVSSKYQRTTLSLFSKITNVKATNWKTDSDMYVYILQLKTWSSLIV